MSHHLLSGLPALLCSWQLFNAADPALADLDETPDHMGADLTASRHDAWQELCMSKVRQQLRWHDMWPGTRSVLLVAQQPQHH